ncbi:hypothetical protein [Actinosynnema sp. NPDC020468]|uniref:hypothetical protein n=1 Tax=Actinosynnema sp. NPDC020468 TaxID=3154488 RepID=UPI0033E3AF80
MAARFARHPGAVERDGPPDIDIESDRREEVVQHVYDKYGRRRPRRSRALACATRCASRASQARTCRAWAPTQGANTVSRRLLGWTMVGVCAAAVVFVVVGGHVGKAVGEPLRLWGRWLSGEKVDDARLWGLPMLVWGRTGKLLQFAAGLTVVLDLVGPERLREFGNRLRPPSWRRLADRLDEPVMTGVTLFLAGYLLLLVGSDVVHPPQAVSPVITGLVRGPAGVTGVVLCFVSIGFVALRRLTRIREDEGAPPLMGYLLVLVVSGVPMLAWIAVTRGLLIPLVNGLARAFDRTDPGHPLRRVAFVLFVVGFGLDLLAS